jgi:hypothetical protein
MSGPLADALPVIRKADPALAEEVMVEATEIRAALRAFLSIGWSPSHDGDDDTGGHDPECRACEWEGLMARAEDALGIAHGKIEKAV